MLESANPYIVHSSVCGNLVTLLFNSTISQIVSLLSYYFIFDVHFLCFLWQFLIALNDLILMVSRHKS